MSTRLRAALAVVATAAALASAAVLAATSAKGTVSEPTAAKTSKAASAAEGAASAPAVAASAPTPFAGTLVTGTVYVADMAYDPRVLRIWRPVKDVVVAKDVAWTIVWTNLDQFPALKTPATQARPQRFRFRVAKTDMISGSPKLPWMVTYQCEVLAFEPVPAAPAAAPAPAAARKR